MKCNVPVAEATSDETVLPERVQEALGELVGAAREGLLALSVEVGLGVLRELLERGGRRGRRSEGQARTGSGRRCVTATRTGR